MSYQKNYIMGKNCIDEVLKARPQHIQSVFVNQNIQKDFRVKSLLDALQKKGCPINWLKSDAISQLVGSDSHQGMAAKIHPRNFLSLSEMFVMSHKRDSVKIVMLDGIQDPQNLGAILRVCHSFNVDFVIWSKNRNVDITPLVAKASMGASELLKIIKISNLRDAIDKCKDNGFWVVGTSSSGESSMLLSDYQFDAKTALILGSEGKGMSSIVQKVCDTTITIEMNSSFDSLNVSQAAAVVLYQWERSTCFHNT